MPPSCTIRSAMQIDVLLDILVDLVEQLVQRDERRALHVPVGLLALGLQVDAVGQALVQQLDDLDPARLGQIVLGGIETAQAVPISVDLRVTRVVRSVSGGGAGHRRTHSVQ